MIELQISKLKQLKILKMDRFIELTASFRSDGQPDFEALGIEVDEDDFDNSEWLPIFINVNNIETINENNSGSTNISMISGGLWSVKESTNEVIDKLKNV